VSGYAIKSETITAESFSKTKTRYVEMKYYELLLDSFEIVLFTFVSKQLYWPRFSPNPVLKDFCVAFDR